MRKQQLTGQIQVNRWKTMKKSKKKEELDRVRLGRGFGGKLDRTRIRGEGPGSCTHSDFQAKSTLFSILPTAALIQLMLGLMIGLHTSIGSLNCFFSPISGLTVFLMLCYKVIFIRNLYFFFCPHLQVCIQQYVVRLICKEHIKTRQMLLAPGSLYPTILFAPRVE